MDRHPLSDANATMVHEAQKFLCKSIGFHQALLHVKAKYALSEEENRRLKSAQVDVETVKKSLEEAENKITALEAERDTAKSSVGRMSEELHLVKGDLKRTSSELATLQEGHLRSLDAVRSLQQQRSSLVSELESTKGALAVEKEAHLETNDLLKETASECFKMALAQIRHLNPLVSLNLNGYDYRAYVQDGVLYPPPSSPDVGSLPLDEVEADGKVEEIGGDVGRGAEVELQASEVAQPSDVAPSKAAAPSS